ncbi:MULTISPECIES: mannitol dehydrogenase family protein [Sphingobium]|jgi:fructuronate reductase|uniref:Mannitol dehydrogenase family protein n=1 Tax=Sphingobium limneticum TaxID=1007511 RepID=A0A5J5I876_9SPHN|nr:MULTISPECIES: mannitol dehydrogenase family protein [Sphingobium]KAA9020304.1 mannitol dehydrogenase family protein [Sphingobium limneticum]KAA9021216.1 mannitol dehydrogenase family protein [Sphingobium limneticum]KAA9033577.1 mannitol dehydrogenase family protein [Sphingobium limneticum]MBU0930706.1 mannitol dehydrogenase family protein [Alphaproteobacteria bacterium]
MTRLSSATLAALPATVARPAYDRSQVKPGVVHLGIGAFHRAHQAVMFDDTLAVGDLRWGIRTVSLRSPGVRDQMAPQDGLYHILVRDGAEVAVRTIGAVLDVTVAPESPDTVVDMLADADTHIVTLTVTEKGYKLDPASGALRTDDPQLAADLASLNAPVTAPGFLVAALAKRRARGLLPFTAISCDNLPRNGQRLRGAVIALAQYHDPALAEWIAQEGAFPETMVDRIVPATTPDDIAAFARDHGVTDEALVKTEPFTQWVIEDRFCGPRPDFGAGVQITAAVAPWEEAKLRLLNGAHSAIAYLGGLACIAHVHEVLEHPAMRAFVERLWDEAESTLSPPAELDVAAYRRDLMTRFDNGALMHRTHQIAMDGSQKLPQRLLATIADRRAEGQDVDALALGVAAWIRWQAGISDAGITHVVDDPLADSIAALLAEAADAAGRVTAILAYDAIMPAALRDDAVFADQLIAHLTSLEEKGAMATVAAMAPIPA